MYSEKRTELYKEIMPLYKVYRDHYPNRYLTIMMENRYGVTSMGLMSLEQVQDILDYLRHQLSFLK